MSLLQLKIVFLKLVSKRPLCFYQLSAQLFIVSLHGFHTFVFLHRDE